jgi:hypothetical protein
MNLPASVAETTIPLALNSCALQQRIHPATSRVSLPAGTTPGRFIGFDLLALSNGDVKASRSQMSRLGLSIRWRRPAPRLRDVDRLRRQGRAQLVRPASRAPVSTA